MELLITAPTSQMIIDWLNGLSEDEAGVKLQLMGIETS